MGFAKPLQACRKQRDVLITPRTELSLGSDCFVFLWLFLQPVLPELLTKLNTAAKSQLSREVGQCFPSSPSFSGPQKKAHAPAEGRFAEHSLPASHTP